MRTVQRGLFGLTLALLLSANLLVGVRLQARENEDERQDDAYRQLELFTEVLQQVRHHYVDEDRTVYKELIRGALDGLLTSLDPHSQFMDADMYTDMQDDTSGQFGGLGVVIGVRDGVLTIVAPMEDTPGFRAGLLAGDRIIEIEGDSTEGVGIEKAIKHLRGAPGTVVRLKVLRPEPYEIMDLEIERAVIEVSSVKDAKMLEQGIGYIRITQFNTPTADTLEENIEELLAQNMQALVLDLRNNPGGLLSSAIEVAQQFLPRGQLIVFTRGRDERREQKFLAKGRQRFTDIHLIILVNQGSASASEIVSGALQDHQRAVLVGEKTFGKGSVQTVLPLKGGSAIRLTTAKYYTPSERVIHDHGIEPDIAVPMDPADWQKLMTQRMRPENSPAESGTESEEVRDVQLERGIDVLKGIMLFETRRRPAVSPAVELSQTP